MILRPAAPGGGGERGSGDDADARFSLDDWIAGPAIQQYCADPANADHLRFWECRIPEAREAMRRWARTRYKTVMQRLKCQ